MAAVEKTALEKELLGLYLSDHPLDQYTARLANVVTHSIEDCRNAGDKEAVVVAGVLTNVRPYYTKAENKQMYFLTLEDKTGTISVTLFPRAAAELDKVPEKDSVVVITGRTSHRDRISRGGDDESSAAASVEIAADKVQPIVTAGTLLGTNKADKDDKPAFSCLHIRLDATMHGKVRTLQQSLTRYKMAGGSRLELHISDGRRSRRVQPSLTVEPDERVVSYLRSFLGSPQAVWTE